MSRIGATFLDCSLTQTHDLYRSLAFIQDNLSYPDKKGKKARWLKLDFHLQTAFWAENVSFAQQRSVSPLVCWTSCLGWLLGNECKMAAWCFMFALEKKKKNLVLSSAGCSFTLLLTRTWAVPLFCLLVQEISHPPSFLGILGGFMQQAAIYMFMSCPCGFPVTSVYLCVCPRGLWYWWPVAVVWWPVAVAVVVFWLWLVPCSLSCYLPSAACSWILCLNLIGICF